MGMHAGGHMGCGGCGARPRFKLIDFSNAMSLGESSAYHDTFEVQTLSYRAPEVIYGQASSLHGAALLEPQLAALAWWGWLSSLPAAPRTQGAPLTGAGPEGGCGAAVRPGRCHRMPRLELGFGAV